MDDVEVADITTWEEALHSYMSSSHGDLLKIIANEADLSDDSRTSLNSAIEEFKKSGLAN